ncbi:General transcription factor II-I repeat domain-containing protein 2 [Melipona quadrifasciata]|uniref:General transcription factor II-I repeat domain-containing protein 2 n=1 Tax=Melipona quadrifasciata TaxID=166423 RepID=A0A0M8ZSW6_9HYME|nr:General transcription factor II-I repeat domain-containing protein 2 [Melipona quadrifasciata]
MNYHLLATKGKPFTDGELIKLCLLVAAEEMCPEKMDLFRSVSLSARTTVRRVEDIESNIKSQLKGKAKSFKWFSLAVDESTDITDTAQLMLFIRGINTEFEVTEELVSVNSLHETTTGEDIFKEVEKMLTQYNLQCNQLKCVTAIVKNSKYALNDYSWQMNLTVNFLEKKDFGEYVCSSVNALGKADGIIHLQGEFDSSGNDDDLSTTQIMKQGGSTLHKNHRTERPLIPPSLTPPWVNINTANSRHNLIPITLFFPLFILTMIFIS